MKNREIPNFNLSDWLDKVVGRPVRRLQHRLMDPDFMYMQSLMSALPCNSHAILRIFMRDDEGWRGEKTFIDNDKDRPFNSSTLENFEVLISCGPEYIMQLFDSGHRCLMSLDYPRPHREHDIYFSS